MVQHRRAAILVLAGVLIAGLALAWIAAGAIMRGRSAAIAPARSPAEDVAVVAADGTHIAGTYRPGRKPDAPAVLLLHGVDASRGGAVAENAAWLADRGYATLAIDFRGHGGSELRSRSFGWHEALDAHGAFAWLKRRQSGAKVAVIGMSMGGAASLIGPAGPVPADALVLQAVYPNIRRAIRGRIAARLGTVPAIVLEPLLSLQSWPRIGVWPSDLSPERALTTERGPVFVIGGAEDAYTPPEQTRALFAAAPRGSEVWIVPRGDHAAISALTGDTYRRRISSFLQRTIG